MLIARLLVAVTGAGMALVLAVVILIYAVHITDTPRLTEQLPTLILTTGIFTLLGGVAVGSALSAVRQWPSQRWWDSALVVTMPVCVWFLWRVYG